MGSERNPDVFVIGRILEAIEGGQGRRAESALHGAGNVNQKTYEMYRDILLSTGDIKLSAPDKKGKQVPVITSEGLETLRACRRHTARWGKENLIVEGIRRKYAEERKAKKHVQDMPEDLAPREDSA